MVATRKGRVMTRMTKTTIQMAMTMEERPTRMRRSHHLELCIHPWVQKITKRARASDVV